MSDVFHIPYIRSVWRLIEQRLGSGGRLCLFGAGMHTRWLLSITSDLPAPTIVCVLDDDPRESRIQQIPVRRPEDIDPDSLDLILVSSDRWEEELTCRCRALWGDRVEIMRLYEGLPRGPYDKVDDRREALRRLRQTTPVRRSDSGLVVMVSDTPRSREAKIAYALRHRGWKCVLLHRDAPTFDASGYFTEARSYGNEWQALRQALDYAPRAYHVMVNSDYRVAERFVRERPGIVVVGSYDMIAGMYTDAFLADHPDYRAEIDRERFCLESADGLCCRSAEADLLETALGYRLPPRVLLFDGCWQPPLDVGGHAGEELHVAYAGHIVAGGGRSSGAASSSSKLWLAETLTAQGIHFHLFPWCAARGAALDDALRDYRDLSRRQPHFHLHAMVPPDRLASAMAACDLGMFVYNEVALPGGIASSFTPDKFRLCASNKLFDYIDAGLPVVHTAIEGSFLSQLMDAHGIRVEVGAIDPAHWSEHLASLDLTALRRGVRAAQADYDLRHHIGKLTRFYESLHA
ncbi:MAG: hypothetical protein ACE5EX_10275, partial [Phycisphaerae bacterium]